ncbi:MAG TPA: DUF1684 domain-containing protein [Roseiflexaceae bacterium]|nr:DUF1684 domain-containing protein [Roseiflexaceae bacterium]
MPTSYEQEILAWRAEMEAALRSDTGWLTVVGLFWLHEGENTVGSDEGCDVLLPQTAPPLLGRIELRDGTATLHVAPGAPVAVNGEPAASRALRSDVPGPADVVSVDDVSFFLIQRGTRLGVRVRDRNSRARREFGGRQWFPVREEYRVEAAFTAYDPPRQLQVLNVLGEMEEMVGAGYVTFTLQGHPARLEAVGTKGGRLWFIFRDQTSGRETYPAARFLYAGPPEGGRVTLDFNRAYSPPCAFTDYATCPLPPPGNNLPLRVEAGELWLGHH